MIQRAATALLGDVREIPLSRGYVALVDAADFEWLSQWRWIAQVESSGRNVYARRTLPGTGSKKLFMHRAVLAAPPGLIVDHKNHNGLDNRRGNLRVCTRSQNNANARYKNRSGFKGVSPRKWGFEVYMKIDGRSVYMGVFPTAEDAARAYDGHARALFGEFACLNFPPPSSGAP